VQERSEIKLSKRALERGERDRGNNRIGKKIPNGHNARSKKVFPGVGARKRNPEFISVSSGESITWRKKEIRFERKKAMHHFIAELQVENKSAAFKGIQPKKNQSISVRKFPETK